MKEKCIICGKETKYDVNTNIDLRYNYVEGAGQLCNDCAKGDNTRQSDVSSNEYVMVSHKDILSRSNNFDLGLFVRTLFNKQK